MPDSWPMALCRRILMACWQRRGQINHLQVQLKNVVLYFSLYEKTGSWLTLPSINKCAEHNTITDQSVLLTAFTQDFLFFTSLGKIKKNWYHSLLQHCLADLSTCKQRNAYYHFVLKNVDVRKRLCACTDNSSAVTVKRSMEEWAKLLRKYYSLRWNKNNSYLCIGHYRDV